MSSYQNGKTLIKNHAPITVKSNNIPGSSSLIATINDFLKLQIKFATTNYILQLQKVYL
jgi:hypothetical protein